MKFIYQSPIEVEESGKQFFVTGCLMSEGLSLNGNYYEFESLKSIAESAVSKPVYMGLTTQLVNGFRVRNLHDRSKAPIGRIVKTWLNKTARRVYFKALVYNREIAEKIKQGWHVSIGGNVLHEIVEEAGRKIARIKRCIVSHLQVFSPEVPSGVQGAEVHQVVQECCAFVTERGRILPLKEIIASLEAIGEI